MATNAINLQTRLCVEGKNKKPRSLNYYAIWFSNWNL